MTIRVIVELQAKPGRRAELRSLLESVVAKYGPDRPGFLGSTCYEVLDNPNILVEIADWTLVEVRAAAMQKARESADVAKIICLGADAVYIGTSALVAMGCCVCGTCYRGQCAWGIVTQKPELTQRLDPEGESVHVANLIHGWTLEIAELMGAAGINSIESLRGNRDRLRGDMLDEGLLNVLDIKTVGA